MKGYIHIKGGSSPRAEKTEKGKDQRKLVLSILQFISERSKEGEITGRERKKSVKNPHYLEADSL